MNDRGEKAGFRLMLATAGLLLAALAAPLALGKVFVHNDIGCHLIPWRAYLADRLHAGEPTAWCPGLFGGYYFLGEGGGVAHPAIRALYSVAPLGAAVDLEIIFPYASMLVGLPLLLTRWGVRRDAAVVGGMVFAFGGPNFVHYIHPSLMVAYGHLPWLLLSADVALRSPSPRRVAWARAAVALLTTSQLLYAHVQAVWIAGLAEGSYALFVAWQAPEARRRLVGWAAFKGLGCLGGAAQLLPLWESFRESARARPSPTYVAMGSVPPLNLIQWVAPYLTASGVVMPPMAFDGGILAPVATRHNDWRVHEFTLYCGAAVPVLLTWLLVRGRTLLPRGANALAVAALVFGAAALVLSFGDYTPLFALTRRVPVIGGFRVPGRYLALVQLAVAVLSALAYGSLALASSSNAEKTAWRRLWPLAAPPVLAVLACLAHRLPPALWPWYVRGEFLAATPWMLAGPALVTASAGLVALAARGSRAAVLALPVLLAADLAAYAARAVLITPPRDIAEYRDARPIPPQIAAGSRVAFDKLHIVDQDVYMMKGLRPIDGYASLPPRRNLSYKTDASLRVAGVEWVLKKDELSPWRRVEGALPRARLVNSTVLLRATEETLQTVDAATTAIVMHPTPTLPDAPPGTARIVRDRPGSIDVLAEAPALQFLIISESFHHGWRVAVDGRRTQPYRAYGDFIGCLVPGGRHRVNLRFRPASETLGFWISAASVAIMLAVPMAATARGNVDKNANITE